MDIEDLEPRAAKARPKNLDDMTVEDLEAYIAELEDEIARVRDKIAGKGGVKAMAESFFKR